MNAKIVVGLSLAVLLAPISILAEVVVTEANNGNLVMEDIPSVPQSVVSDLNRYQNVRSASFQTWAEEVGTARAACDYIAGMTDRFAESEHERLAD